MDAARYRRYLPADGFGSVGCAQRSGAPTCLDYTGHSGKSGDDAVPLQEAVSGWRGCRGLFGDDQAIGLDLGREVGVAGRVDPV